MLREADQGLRMESELDFFDDDEGSNRRFLQKVQKLDEDVLARSHIETEYAALAARHRRTA
jgi:hypothetical protein